MAEILMQFGERTKLARKFGVSQFTLRRALKFRTKSRLANMLRKAALESGGVLVGAKSLREAANENSGEGIG